MRAIEQTHALIHSAGRLRLALALPALMGALLLAACGGGLYVSVGSGFDDSPPSVTLATAANSVVAGQQVQYAAAAADESGIDNVALYRVDGSGSVLLGRVSQPPYDWLVTAPADGRVTLSVFARATDNNGNRTDSAVVSIPVVP